MQWTLRVDRVPELSIVEAKAGPKSHHRVNGIESIVDCLKQAPDYRKRVGS